MNHSSPCSSRPEWSATQTSYGKNAGATAFEVRTSPRVSVIMPVFKVERYLAAAIESVLAQQFPDFELILVDDASPDTSADVIREFDDVRIRYLRHEQNRGISAARNTGIDSARGEFIAFLDSDDTAVPGRLAEQVAVLDAHPQTGLVGSWAELVNESGHHIGFRENPFRDDLIRPLLLFRNTLTLSSLIVRRSALPHGLFNTMLAEDYDFISRIPKHWKFAVLPEVLVQYRINQQGAMSSKWAEVKAGAWKTQLRLLRELGVEPSAPEADLHQRISHATRDGIDPGTAQAATGWIARIIEANRHSNCYRQNDLEAAAGEVLFSLWRQTTSEGRQVIRAANASCRSIGYRPRFADGTKFVVKALLSRS